jgi:hypothetical protein
VDIPHIHHPCHSNRSGRAWEACMDGTNQVSVTMRKPTVVVQ